MTDSIKLITDQCDRIHNSRTMNSVAFHLEGEMSELQEEIGKMVCCQEQGTDGVIGEAVDVLICAIDLAKIWDKSLTPEQIRTIVERKLAKWERLYG